MARTLKLTIAYDGTAFAGWQRQTTARTVQAVVEDALGPIEKAAVSATAAGRTDAGVHAAAQVVSVTLESAIALAELVRALNATLPDDVRVLAIEEAPVGFNARRHARRKTYRYSIWNGVAVPPPLRHLVWHLPQPIDVEEMSAAASMLIGQHDFAAFQATGSDVATTVRRIMSSSVQPVEVGELVVVAIGDRLLRYEISGSGFLRHMVRNIVGTLADVGRGRLGSDEVTSILASRIRSQASATAPPHGLVLWKVEY